ncbi:helix-turn-helix domain-containing protein [Leuconostoc carnosum]|uniref:helix-turn-helix domain-containing protein n=1 Tax=Leuconostoc carnosum TaxID=1252 RepID=UPI00123BB578|nr:helix-turn-helix domain-containing protein [Leuconostoc carnosum]KAA8373140.1 helix-turn-helix domain-containing protein [Leuconostoc carnosum]
MTTTNRIKELRTKQGKTLRDVAKAVNTSNQNISNWERGKSEPKLEMWKKLADYFGVSVAELMGVDSDDMSQILLDDYLRYEKYFVEQYERMNKVPANDIAVSSIAEAMDLILTARGKYSDSSEISTYINTLMTNLKQLIINSNTTSEHDDENKNKHLYSETVNNFTTLLDKIEEQNKKSL